MRRLKRHQDFNIQLELKNETFIAPPRESQRAWLVNRALSEFSWDLEALNRLAQRFVAGQEQLIFHSDDENQVPDADHVMEQWQLPIMQRMAELATANNGSVLEIGFGRGVSAQMIQKLGVRRHTIVECVPAIADQCRHWAAENKLVSVEVLEGRWEAVIDQFDEYDGIFFHTYPMDGEEYAQSTRNSATVAEPFFEVASRFLKDNGVFTYFSNEIDSLSRPHQRALLNHFSEIHMELCSDLDLPEDVLDTWWINQMLIVSARRPKNAAGLK